MSHGSGFNISVLLWVEAVVEVDVCPDRDKGFAHEAVDAFV